MSGVRLCGVCSQLNATLSMYTRESHVGIHAARAFFLILLVARAVVIMAAQAARGYGGKRVA